MPAGFRGVQNKANFAVRGIVAPADMSLRAKRSNLGSLPIRRVADCFVAALFAMT